LRCVPVIATLYPSPALALALFSPSPCTQVAESPLETRGSG
jgi:hypothetical protein